VSYPKGQAVPYNGNRMHTPIIDTSNARYAPSGNALCGCPMCGPKLEALIRQHTSHTSHPVTVKPSGVPREATTSTPLPDVWTGLRDE
jgi:hypothetical protein